MWGTQSLGALGASGYCGAVCPKQLTRDSGLGGIRSSLWYRNSHINCRRLGGGPHMAIFFCNPLLLLAFHLMLDSKLCYIQGSFSWQYPGFASLFDVGHGTIVLKDNEKENGRFLTWSLLPPVPAFPASEEVELVPWLSLPFLILPLVL